MVRYDFRGRTVFVTGGTSGIGLATARAFDVVAINARGVWLSMRHEIRAMLGSGGGRGGEAFGQEEEGYAPELLERTDPK